MCVAFICGKGIIYPYINKSPFCVRTQYTLLRLFPFSCCIAFAFVVLCSFSRMMQRYFLFAFVSCLVYAFKCCVFRVA